MARDGTSGVWGRVWGAGNDARCGAVRRAAAEHPWRNRANVLLPQNVLRRPSRRGGESLRLLLPSALSHGVAWFNHLEFV